MRLNTLTLQKMGRSLPADVVTPMTRESEIFLGISKYTSR